MKNLYILAILFVLIVSCNKEQKTNQGTVTQKTGVLIVSHGSRSETWRKTLLSLEDSVKSEVLKNKKISGIKSAFMEFNEPSITTRLKEFEAEGYSSVIIIPALLTISSHSFDDIPTIVGLKSNPSDVERIKPKLFINDCLLFLLSLNNLNLNSFH